MDTFKEVLLKIIHMSGKDILKDRKRLSAYLADIGPEYKKEIHIFQRACTKEILQIFYSSDGAAVKERLQTARKVRYRLTEEEGLAESWADMIIESLSYALGWEETGSDDGSFEKYNTAQYRNEGSGITDSWEEIFAAIEAGTYRENYRIGDTKLLDLGPEGSLHMQIAAFDTDVLADRSKNAPITWISKELLKTRRGMNPVYKTDGAGYGIEGTGAFGGWEPSGMRIYLNEVILPYIPWNIRSHIKKVVKKQKAISRNRNYYMQTTQDEVWIPDIDEVFGMNAVYQELFSDADSKVKHIVGGSDAFWWWLRTVYGSNSFHAIGSGGSPYYNYASNTGAVPLGFCI